MSNQDTRAGLAVLDEGASMDSQQVDRLVAVIAGRPEVFPMNFVLSEGAVLMHTGPGTKLEAVGTEVAFEVDGTSPQLQAGFSVVLRGQLERVEDSYAVQRAELSRLLPWAEGAHGVWLRIVPTEVSGRRVAHGEVEFTD